MQKDKNFSKSVNIFVNFRILLLYTIPVLQSKDTNIQLCPVLSFIMEVQLGVYNSEGNDNKYWHLQKFA